MPQLPAVVDALDKVPEPARQFYSEASGKFVLNLEGAVPGFAPAADLATANGRVVEFRDKNVALLKEVEDLRPLKAKFEGLDPEAARTAIAEVAALKARGVGKPDDISVLIQSAVAAAVKPMQEQMSAGVAATAAANKRADESVLRSFIGEKFVKAGGEVKATDFILGQARDVFVVEDGVVKALPNKYSTAKPGDPLDVDEWLVSAAKDFDFAFKPSGGSGARPSSTSSSFGRGGQTILKDPTPAQLGEFSKEILAGKVRVEYSVQ